ncbi:MAG: site-specific integrase [Micavibrio sp.]|nr:site-specific integrase [Micavibrio sp.]
MKAIERHLYVRKGYYYYRCRIPKYLNSFFPREFVIALRTRDLSEGRILSVKLDYELEKHLRGFQASLIDLKPEQSPEQALDQLISHVNNLRDLVGFNLPQSISALKANRPLFSDIAKRYLEDCTNSSRTHQHKENTFTLFKELMGDIVFKEIGIAEARRFKSCLRKIPSNAKKIWNITSFEGVDLDKLSNGKLQHPSTINNRLSCLIALFTWAGKAEYYHAANPFSNLVIKGQQLSTRRHPFKPEELKTLFLSPLFTGCKGRKAAHRLQAGKEIIQDALYWVPLIGLYSGMRLGEICQLYVTDIRQEEGVYIFDVNDEGKDKALKTPSSRRKVPVHKELIRRGFLHYVANQRKQRENRLFPDVAMGSIKTYSSTFTKRFWRVLSGLELKRQGLCFHSLRHNFIDGLRNGGVERSIVMTMTGHQSSKGVHDDYGYGYNLSVLQEGINKLTFPYLEGTHVLCLYFRK